MSDAILDESRYIGTLSNGKTKTAIIVDVIAGSDGRLHLTPVDVSGELFFLIRPLSKPGEATKEFSLSAEDEVGRTITSETVYVTGWHDSTQGYTIDLNVSKASVTQQFMDPEELPFKRVYFRGLKSFGRHFLDCQLGKAYLQGDTPGVEQDKITGAAGIQSSDPEPDDRWHSDANKLLMHIQCGMGFAHGGRLQVPLLEEVAAGQHRMTFYQGRGWQSEYPVIPYLNHQPFFEALVRRFEERGPIANAFWTALGWVQVETAFDDVRFLTAMTAIETITQNALPESDTTIIPKTTFKKGLRSKLERVVESETDIECDKRKIFKGKVAQLNSRTLSQKIDAMFDHFDLPKIGFEGDTIVDLIKLRNKIIHQVEAPDPDKIHAGILHVREIFTRLLLREIGFVGQYYCYIRSREDQQFPASEVYPR
jgi:hypothetical protein